VNLLARRAIAGVAAIAAFWLGLWIDQQVHWSWLPHAPSDRWVVAAAFATITATVALTLAGAWAEQKPTPEAPATPASPESPPAPAGGGDHIEFHGKVRARNIVGKGTLNDHTGRDHP
jgi:hypothetical protein